MIQTLLSNIWWIVLVILGIGLFLFKKISKNPDAGTSHFRAKKILHTDVKTSEILIIKALERAGFSNVKSDETGTKIQAKSGFSMSSWSEYIEVSLKEKEGGTKMKFKSICAFSMQLFDWGKNKENYRRFAKELETLMRASS